MIHYLKIRNFGPVKDEVQLNFEAEEKHEDAYETKMPDGTRLLKLAYIYGANASGKTTILKAFDFLRRLLTKPVTDKAVELDYEPFLFRQSPYTQASEFELSFYADGIRHIYNVAFNKQAVLNEKIVFYQTAKPTELFTRNTDVDKRLTTIEFGSRIKVAARERDLLEGNTLHNNSVIGGYAKTNVDIPELEVLNRWFDTYLLGLITSNDNLTEITASYLDRNPLAASWISAFMNKADHQISEVKVFDFSKNYLSIPLEENFFLPQKSESKETKIKAVSDKSKYFGGGSIHRQIDFVHTLKDGNYSLSILKESNGTKRYFGLGGPLYELVHNSHLLCIDELETSLHPDLMVFFLQVFLLNSKQSQMLVTTHNVSLMENLDFLRKDALWFSEKDDTGAVSLYSASDFDSSTLRKDANILRAYRSGKLGAKPNLGSPYLIEE
jgi:AAA15 family ATPase/GTPase